MPEGTSQACPACGVMVLIGYAKCPKCHAPMPAAASRAKRASFQGGGTSSQPMERVDDGGSGSGWLLPVVGIVLVAGVVVWATALRGGSSKKQSTEAAAPIDDGAGVGSETAPTPANNVDQLPPPTSQNRPDPAYVADALEGELSVERLFATVDISNDTLEMRSAFCSEPRLSEITARYAAELKAAGLVRIRCSETHGAQVFERAL